MGSLQVLGGRVVSKWANHSCEWPHAPVSSVLWVQLSEGSDLFTALWEGPNEMLHITCPVDLHIMSLL